MKIEHENVIRQVPVPSRSQLRAAIALLLLVGLMLLSPVFLRAQVVNLETRRGFTSEAQAWAAALEYGRSTKPLPPAFVGKVKRIFVVPGTGSMAPVLFKNNVCVIEGVSFDEVVPGDVACFKTKRDAYTVAKYGVANGYTMHPVVSRTKDRLVTCGMESILNPYPNAMFDGPVERDNFVGVVRVAFNWN